MYSCLRSISPWPLAVRICPGNIGLRYHPRILVSQQLSILNIRRELLPDHTKYCHHSSYHLLSDLASHTSTGYHASTRPRDSFNRCQRCHLIHGSTRYPCGSANGDYPIILVFEDPANSSKRPCPFDRAAFCFCSYLSDCGVPCEVIHHGCRGWRYPPRIRLCSGAGFEHRAWIPNVVLLGQGWRKGARHTSGSQDSDSA